MNSVCEFEQNENNKQPTGENVLRSRAKAFCVIAQKLIVEVRNYRFDKNEEPKSCVFIASVRAFAALGRFRSAFLKARFILNGRG